MKHCNKCGQVNSQESNFCRFCGSRIELPQPGFNPAPPFPQPNPLRESFESSPPRPHVWKTDEFQVKESKARPTEQINMVQPLANMDAVTNQTARQQPLTAYQHGNITYGYRCPRCSSQLLPKIERKISNAGWVVFAAFLVFFFPLFWIGLLIKEDVRVCPVCNLKIN